MQDTTKMDIKNSAITVVIIVEFSDITRGAESCCTHVLQLKYCGENKRSLAPVPETWTPSS